MMEAVMKKLHLILCILAIAMGAVSCKKDNDGTKSIMGKNSNKIGVLVNSASSQSGPASKSGSSVETLFTIPVETDNGDTLYVTATLSDMDEEPYSEVVTKGAPVTTANISSIYGECGFTTSVYDTDGNIYVSYDGNERHDAMSGLTVKYGSGSWGFYDGESANSYYWPEDGSPLSFCSYAPSTASVSDVAWTPLGESTKATFHYAVSTSDLNTESEFHDAEDQPDLMFAFNRNSINDHKRDDGESYAAINFSHALVGVKFIRGNIVNCTVTGISLENFYSEGDATAKVKGDNSLEFSWSGQTTKTTFKQTFNTVVDDDIPHQDKEQKIVTGGSLDPTPTEDYTFMVIPQKIAEDAKILISLAERIHPIECVVVNQDPNLQDWSGYAGKMITISVSSNFDGELVDIEMQEDVSVPLEKKDVKVDNLGSLPVYVRAALVANWVKADGTVIYPYQVLAENLGGLDTGKWTYNGGFFYYKYQLPVGDETTFFTRFKSPVPGDPDYPSGVPDVDHLEMTVMFQAVDAKGRDGKTGKEIIAEYGWPSEVFEN